MLNYRPSTNHATLHTISSLAYRFFVIRVPERFAAGHFVRVNFLLSYKPNLLIKMGRKKKKQMKPWCW